MTLDSYYSSRLDRWIDHSGVYGSRSSGFHRFMMDEVELGGRVAMGLDEEQAWGPILTIFWLGV